MLPPARNPSPTVSPETGCCKTTSELPQRRAAGRYVLLEVLREGGTGVVYKAYDPELNRGVALKVIRPIGEDQALQAASSSRLLREAQALAQLNHPNVVRVQLVEVSVIWSNRSL